MNGISTVKRRRGRPPKDQAVSTQSKSALIRSGMEMLTQRGYSASGLDAILRQAGVPKGSFYHYFESKDAFGITLIRNYSEFFQHKLDKFLSDRSRPPLQRLLAFVNDAARGMARYEFQRGCLVGNLGQEMGALPETFRRELKAAFAAWQKMLAACLEEARATGAIAQQVDCKEASYLFWTGWEGAVLRAKLERSAKPLKAFANHFIASLA